MTHDQMLRLLHQIIAQLPANTGAMLLVFDLGAGGDMNYVCNAKREHMLAALHELTAHLQQISDPKEALAALEATAKRLRESMQ